MSNLKSAASWLLVGLIWVSGAVHAQNASDVQKETNHVYLLIGQSNMAGRAPITEAESGIIERCYLLNGEDQWEPARNPLNLYSSIRKKINMQKMNPGYGFSKAMLEKDPGISLGLVVNAKGGTKIELWEKGTSFYDEAIRRVRVAQQTGILKGILWHQGESNSRNPQEYLGKLKALITDLREDIGIADLPFVVGQVYYHPETKSHTKPINEVMGKLPNEVPFTGCVSSEGLTTFDNTHFDTSGMKLLGERYAITLLKIMEKQESNPLVRALELDKAGDWDEAHNIAQDIHSADGSWLHAYLHRKEGDLGNAGYWYSRADKRVPEDTLEDEWNRLYAAFK